MIVGENYDSELMQIGVIKEIKNGEHRVGLIPAFVSNLVLQGHNVYVEEGAGNGAGFDDTEYIKAGARIINEPEEIWKSSELIIKVKEPLDSEYGYIQPRQILFTYLHLAPNTALTNALVNSKAICVAYETVTDNQGKLPLLAPMSSIAGRMSVLVASNLLQQKFGGAGILPCSIPGVPSAKILILGGGTVGFNATFVAHGIGGDVTVLDNKQQALDNIHNQFNGQVKTSYSTRDNIEKFICKADIVICAALNVGAKAPQLISKDMISNMKKGSVIVDVAIDQGGCCETSKPTTHDDPIYIVDGIIHYCVTNMPGAYANTASISLNNATFPYIEKLAKYGSKAFEIDSNLKNGLNIYEGKITNQEVINAQM